MCKFLNSKSIEKEKDYFQEIINSFDNPALICDFKGKILFANTIFQKHYDEEKLLVSELLSNFEVEKIIFGSDLNYVFSNKISCKYNIYKLLNNTKNFSEDLFIVVFHDIQFIKLI